MVRVKKTVRLGGKERQERAKMEQWQREERKESIKWVGKSIREARKAMKQAAKARREAKHKPYHLWPGSKALHEI